MYRFRLEWKAAEEKVKHCEQQNVEIRQQLESTQEVLRRCKARSPDVVGDLAMAALDEATASQKLAGEAMEYCLSPLDALDTLDEDDERERRSRNHSVDLQRKRSVSAHAHPATAIKRTSRLCDAATREAPVKESKETYDSPLHTKRLMEANEELVAANPMIIDPNMKRPSQTQMAIRRSMSADDMIANQNKTPTNAPRGPFVPITGSIRILAVMVLAIYNKAVKKALAQKANNKMYFKLNNVVEYYRMAHQLYRNTTIGTALSRTLDEFVEAGLITPALAMKVLTTFDKTIKKALATQVNNKVQFNARELVAYQYCDNVWKFVIDGVEFRDTHRSIDHEIDRVKIVAYDASLENATTGSK